MVFMMEDLGAEPVKQCFFIGVAELSYLGYLADLRPVGFDGPTFPCVLCEEGSINPNLGRKKAYHLGSHLLPGAGKAAIVLQTLE
jgi:hypothetical protein